MSGVPVSASSSGSPPGAARADAVGEREHVLRALRLQVLDEMRLVDDHALEAERRQPCHVPIEHVVVDDDDVCEGVERVAVAVDDRGPTVRGPPLDLACPVHLDDVGNDREQRVGIGDGCREHRLRRLAEARLVGEQERAMTVAGALDEPCLVLHELEAARREPVDGRRLGELHRGGAPARAHLERLEQRAEQLPVGEAPHGDDRRGGLREVGREEGVRELPRADGRRNDLVLVEFELRVGLTGDDELVGAELGARTRAASRVGTAARRSRSRHRVRAAR